MAYHFTAETTKPHSTSLLGRRLARYTLIEFFPVDISDNALPLGISIPFRESTDIAALEVELSDLMTYLIIEASFEVTDLYTGERVGSGEIAGLAKRVWG